MKIVNLRNNAALADKAKLADNFLGRLIGLLNRRSLEKGEALILRPSNCIHSFFMRFTIDVLFLDKSGKVVACLPSFRPFRFSPVYFNAHTVIELPEHTLKLSAIQPGDNIQII